MSAPELPAEDWRRSVYGRSAIGGQDRRRGPRAIERARVMAEQGNKCLYCDLPIGVKVFRRSREIILRPNWDHFIPYSYLAQNPATNWVLACHVCNGIKTARLFDSVQAARAVILPRREAKGYEPVREVLLRLAAESEGKELWPERLRLVNGYIVHCMRRADADVYAAACGRTWPQESLRPPLRTSRMCTKCVVIGSQ